MPRLQSGLRLLPCGSCLLAQEFFEYTPGVLRAYVKPKHLDALTFTLQPVIEAGSKLSQLNVARAAVGAPSRPLTDPHGLQVHLGRSQGAERRREDCHLQAYVPVGKGDSDALSSSVAKWRATSLP